MAGLYESSYSYLVDQNTLLKLLFTSTQLDLLLHCLLDPPWVGYGHKIVLRIDMFYGNACLQDDIFFESIGLKEVILCRRKCLVGVHVLVECMFL